MQYMRAISFIFGNRRWWLFSLIGTVAFFVPVLGMLVLVGYMGEMVEKFHRTGRDEYEDFDFNRLGPYLMRGLWAFVGALIISMVCLPVVMLLAGVPIFGGIAMGAAAENESIALIGVILGMGIYTVLVLLLTLVSFPVMLGGALGQSLQAALSKELVLGFIRRVWLETILITLWMTFIALIAMILGLAMCFVGMYPMMVLVMLCQWHLLWQLYELYLERGGTPIPLKEEES